LVGFASVCDIRPDANRRGTGLRRLRFFGPIPNSQEIAMADNRLQGKKVAVLATDGVEQVELTTPVKALKDAGAQVEVVSPKSGQIQGFNHFDKADMIPVDRELSQSRPEEYDALVLPGGVINPDQLRLVPQAIEFVRAFVQSDKPIAAICHGPWTLINARGVAGRRMTSWPSLEVDLDNAGADWFDEEVVVDGNLTTSRRPADLPAFCSTFIEEFAKARPVGAGAGGRADMGRGTQPQA
jgi:protease I